jgi:biotin transport system substrate-specific component
LRLAMMTRTALMAAVTAVAAQIAIPIFPVPFTLQVLAVVLSGLLLGPRYGALAQVIYLLVGAVWLSVVTDLPLAVAVAQGVLIFVPFDLIKVALAALVAVAAAPAIAPSRV